MKIPSRSDLPLASVNQVAKQTIDDAPARPIPKDNQPPGQVRSRLTEENVRRLDELFSPDAPKGRLPQKKFSDPSGSHNSSNHSV